MDKITFSELCGMDVINLCDGKKLGHICDLEIGIEDYCLCSLIIPHDNGSLNPFCKKEYYIIPVCRIECIGNDAVLIKIPPTELLCCELCKRNKRKK